MFSRRGVMRKTTLAILACILGMPLWSQQVTMVAICNYTQVLTTSYRESQAVRDLETLRLSIQKELQTINQDISILENQRVDADKAGNKDLVLQLDDQIGKKKDYYTEVQRIRTDAYNRQRDKILSTAVLKDILDAVRYIAEKEGYALVIRSDGPGKDLILANIPEVDITTKVIKRIYELANKVYTEGG
jgi:Skp family chaperone for outer membrane proteins